LISKNLTRIKAGDLNGAQNTEPRDNDNYIPKEH